MKYKYLVIEGNIGAGKTSLAGMIAKKYKADIILEQFEENPFLLQFYADPERYSFPLELSFLTLRFHQLTRELENLDLSKSFVVADYIFSKSLIFAGVTLRDDDFASYRQLYNILDHDLPKPDLLIYLYLSVSQLMNNIKNRGRAYEQNISEEYLGMIQDSYLNWFQEQQEMKVLIIEGETIDFINNQEEFNQIDDIIFQKQINPGMNRVLIS